MRRHPREGIQRGASAIIAWIRFRFQDVLEILGPTFQPLVADGDGKIQHNMKCDLRSIMINKLKEIVSRPLRRFTRIIRVTSRQRRFLSTHKDTYVPLPRSDLNVFCEMDIMPTTRVPYLFYRYTVCCSLAPAVHVTTFMR